MPEVSLVVILDADKEGFLRSETALIQTCGRAARNVEGKVIMYADRLTKSIASCVEITQKRRVLQQAYNARHGIVPTTVQREIAPLVAVEAVEALEVSTSDKAAAKSAGQHISENEVLTKIAFYEKEMKLAAKELRFEDAAHFRDLLHKYEALLDIPQTA